MTVKEIYDKTMALMDEMKDNAQLRDHPNVDYDSTKDYQARTPGILTILQTEVVMFLKGAGVDIDSLDAVETMDDEVDLDQDICYGVLTYGLAARLLGQEDERLSSYFSSLYNNGLAMSKDSAEDKYIAKQIARENVYGLFRAGD